MKKRCLSISCVAIFMAGATLAPLAIASPATENQETQQMQKTLSQSQQALIPIAAFAAVGDLEKLKPALAEGLEQGLTINQIKALLVQTYAYAGFPRSLNALGTFMQLLAERKEQGITDKEGPASTALPADYKAIVQGTANQTKLVGHPVAGPLFDFAPEVDEYLKTHLFGDMFSRDVLTWQDREIATVSMLAAMTGTDGQLKAHIGMCMNTGVTKAEMQKISDVLSAKVAKDVGAKVAGMLD